MVLLAQILEELRSQGEILRKAAGFLDNPVRRYRQSMREAKRDRGGDGQSWDRNDGW